MDNDASQRSSTNQSGVFAAVSREAAERKLLESALSKCVSVSARETWRRAESANDNASKRKAVGR